MKNKNRTSKLELSLLVGFCVENKLFPRISPDAAERDDPGQSELVQLDIHCTTVTVQFVLVLTCAFFYINFKLYNIMR